MPKTLEDLLTRYEDEIAARQAALVKASSEHFAVTSDDEIEHNVRRSLRVLGPLHREPESEAAKDYIDHLCRQRVPRGFRHDEVLSTIFGLAEAIVPVIREHVDDPALERLACDQLRQGISRLALLWSQGYFELYEELIASKERAMRQLSTPVIQVWDGILTLPLVGDVDDLRSRQVTEELLERIIETQSDYVLVDITGLGSINTSVIAQLIRTVRAAELLGAQCWIVGVSPAVAQTIVGLGVDLQRMVTYASLREGLAAALRNLGLRVAAEQTA